LPKRSRFPDPRTVACLSTAVLLAVASAAIAWGEETPLTDWIERGNAAFDERFSPEKMDEAIAAYETALATFESLPPETHAFVLNRLTQLSYERTTFTPGNTPDDKLAFQAGKNYGLLSLRLNPAFAAMEEDDFDAAVAAVTDPSALLWTADNWGALFAYDPIGGMFQIGKVRALYERCLEIDETYWGASAHNALGAMLVVTPTALGGDEAAGLDHLERAVALDPTYLINRVVRAQYWGFTYDLFGNINGIRDAAFVEEQLGIVLDAPIADWPFWNREAQREAQDLLAELEERMS
jgi:hypothetical protein